MLVERTYKTGEVAEFLGVTRSTLLKWLRAGVMPEVSRDQNNNYRVWTVSDLRTALRVWLQREEARIAHARAARNRSFGG